MTWPLVLLVGSTAGVLSILLAWAVIGRSLLRLFGPLPLTREEEFFYGIGLGMGILSYAVYLIGLMGWLREGIPMLLIATAGWTGVTLTFGRGGQEMREMVWAGLSAPLALARELPRFYLFSVATILLLSFLGSGVPVHVPDDMHLYSLLPKRFIEAGRIVGWTDAPLCAALCMIPLGALTLFAFFYGIGGDLFVTVFQFLTGLLAVVATGVLFRRIVGTEAALLGALIFVTTPVVVLVLSGPRVDLLLALMATLGLHALERGVAQGREAVAGRFFILGAIFLGLAISVKLTAIPLIVVLYAGLMLLNLRRTFVLSPRQVIGMAMVSVITAVPWLARAWWYTGNPVWPFLNESLSRLGLSVLPVHGSIFPTYGSVFVSPVEVLIRAWRFVYDFSNSTQSGAQMLSIMFFPLIILFWSSGFAVRALAVLSASYFWLLLSIAPNAPFRHVMAGVPGISIVAAYSLVALNHRFSWVKPVTRAMVAFSCVVAVLFAVRANYHRLPYITGIETRQQFLTRMNLALTLRYVYPHSMFLLQDIVKESGVLFFSNRLRYDAAPMGQYKAYYGEELFRRARNDALAAAKRGEVSFFVTADSDGRLKLIATDGR